MDWAVDLLQNTEFMPIIKIDGSRSVRHAVFNSSEWLRCQLGLKCSHTAPNMHNRWFCEQFRGHRPGAACAEWKTGWSTSVFFIALFTQSSRSDSLFFYKFKTFMHSKWLHPLWLVSDDCISQRPGISTEPLSGKQNSLFCGGNEPGCLWDGSHPATIRTAFSFPNDVRLNFPISCSSS